jgi:hypothetical protein
VRPLGLRRLFPAHAPAAGGAALCAVQAFSPSAKTLAQAELISAEHFKENGSLNGAVRLGCLEKPAEMDGETLIAN